MDDLVGIATNPLDISTLTALGDMVARDDHGDGAVVTFVGKVRSDNAGRRVVHLEYEAYAPLAVKALKLIVSEAGEKWPSVKLAMRHRIGRLLPGEPSVMIAAGSPHRGEAFGACRYAIERIKQVVPIWKREVFDGGEVWIEGAVADPNDVSARELAYRRACV